MNDESNHPRTDLTMEEGVQVLLSNARKSIHKRYEKCENRVRKSPATAMVGAIGVGYFLHLLPVRAILVTKIRILSALTPPTLVFFGAAKLYDYLKKQSSSDKIGNKENGIKLF